MKTYLYPENLKATAKLWLWSIRDFVILSIALLISIIILSQTGFILPIAIVLCFAFMTIRLTETTILDYLIYAFKFFILDQQQYIWKEGEY